MVDIGDFGSNRDGGVYSSCNLGVAINENKLGIPNREKMWNNNVKYNYVFVGGAAFPSKTNLLKPYPKESMGIKERIINYRLSRCRRVIENTFGIFDSRFRIYRRPVIAAEKLVTDIANASVVLHKYLMNKKNFNNPYQYCPPEFID